MENEYVKIGKVLPDFVKSFNTEDDGFSVSFKLLDTVASPDLSPTVSKDIKVAVTVQNKMNGSTCSMPILITRIPVETHLGYKINGTLYSMMGIDKRACGWYISQQNRGGMKSLTLEFVPHSGMRIIFLERNSKIQVFFNLKNYKARVPVGIFLKALTGKTYRELISILGSHNRLILQSLQNEQPRDFCLEKSLLAMGANPANLPEGIRYKELKRRLTDKYSLNPGNAGTRTARQIKFEERAEGAILAVQVAGYQRGTVLTKEILRKLDEDPSITTLFVKYEGKVFELKKYQISADKPFSEEELFTLLNMYAVTLDGFGLADNSLELTNRRTQSYKDSVCEVVETALNRIIYSVKDFFQSNGENADLASFKFPTFHPDDYINKLKTSLEVQNSETINGISLASKQDKIVSDMSGRGGENFVTVKDTERFLYDPLAQPESKKIGFVHYKTLDTRLSPEGELTGTFAKVTNGVVDSSAPVYLNAYTIKNSIIAPWDADLTQPQVVCLYGSRTITVPVQDVQYQEWSPFGEFSLSTALIPFVQFSDGKRNTMGGNFTKQAVQTIHRERPLVSTGVCGYYNLGVVRCKEILERYYVEHTNSIPYTLEEFLKAKLNLVTTEITIPGYRQLLCNIITPEKVYATKYTIPYSKRTTDSTLSQFEIKPAPNGDWIYHVEDVICYDSSYTLDKCRLIVHSDLGHMKADEENLMTDLAVGNNFLVGWKPFDSTTVDDAFTISGNLIGSNKLAHCAAYEKEASLKEPSKEDGSYETFELAGNLPGFNPNGLPKIGTYLKPGSVVISRVLHSPNGDKNTSVRLDADTEGEVIAASITPEGKALVYLARIADISIGDKVCGRHGNKGTIGRIVPESDMPYLEDGTPLDFCMNPLAVPSRANLSQFLEAILGWAARLQGDDVAYVISTQNRNSYDIVQDTIERYNVHPQTLYDGRTSQPFPRKINVGYLYVEKLRHDSISKSNSTGINTRVNPETLQARKGKKVGGGQTVGEMETWALLSAGATTTLQEIFSLLSNDIVHKFDVKRFAESGDEKWLANSNNNNDSALVVPCRCLGVDLITESNGYKEKIMTDADITALAPKAIDLHPDALQDPIFFGTVSESASLASTRHTWGFMPLNCEIVSPLWIYSSNLCNLILATQETYDFEKQTIHRKPRTLNSLLVRKVIASDDEKYTGEKQYLAVEGSEIFVTTDPSVSDRFWKTGIAVVVEAFKAADLSKTSTFYASKLDAFPPPDQDEIFKIKEILSEIDDIVKTYGDLSFAIISHFPIMPRNFRLPAMGRQSNFDVHYSGIISAALATKTVDKSTEVYRRIVAFTGLDDKIKHKKDLVSLLSYFTGKGLDNNDGFLRDHTLSTVVDLSLRGVITPASTGELKITEIGIPYTKALVCLKDFIKPKVEEYFKEYVDPEILEESSFLDELYGTIVNKDVYTLADLISLEIDETREILNNLIESITDFCETKVVIAGRQPTLHKYGIRGFMVKLVSGTAIRLHPVVCKAYNADFDGDQMYAIFALSTRSKNEILRTMSPACDLLNPKDDSFVLEPTQDTVLGIYLMTMLKDNVLTINDRPSLYNPDRIVHYDDIDMIYHDVNSQIIEPYNLVCLHLDGKRYLSTAGRILFNSCLPDCFTDEEFSNPLQLDFIDPSQYKELRFDALIKSKKKDDKIVCATIKSVCEFLYKNYNGVQVCDGINNLFIFGSVYADVLGLSLSYDDYIEHPELDSLKARADELTAEINAQFDLGILSESGRKESTAKVNNLIIEYVKDSLVSYYPRNNNLFIMMDSGAKGNVSQLAKACGFIGNIARSSSESLETPVLGNYRRGLRSAEQARIACGTRRGFSSTLNDTALAGTLTRAAVDTLAGFKIVEHDCGNEEADLKVLYTDEPLVITYKGKQVSFDELIGLYVDDDDPNYAKYTVLDSDVFNTSHIYFIRKNRIRTVKLEGAVLEIKYHISELFRSLMQSRLAKDLPYLYREGASATDFGFITDKTLDYIEENNLEKIKVRTMLTCKSVGGVCAKCYGLKPDVRKYPLVGENIGITSAQALGEPATQLTMNVNNQGGAAGAGMVSGVSTFSAYMGGSVPGKAQKVVVAESSGYVKLTPVSQDYLKLVLGSQVVKVHQADLIVRNGEFVQQGQALTTGCLDVNMIKLPNLEDTIRTRQLELLKILYGIFAENNITVNARNFEAIVRVQTSLVRVINSDNPDFKEGFTYFLQELEKANVLDNIKVFSKIEKTAEVINHYSSNIANLTHSYFASNLAKGVLIPSKREVKAVGPLAKLVVGENLVTCQPKQLHTLKHFNLDNFSNNDESFDVCKEIESLAASEVENVTMDNALQGIDLFSALNLDSNPVEKEELEAAMTVDEEVEMSTTSIEDEEPEELAQFSSSSFFGGSASIEDTEE